MITDIQVSEITKRYVILTAAMLHRAILDAQSSDPELAAEAWEWLNSTGLTWTELWDIDYFAFEDRDMLLGRDHAAAGAQLEERI